MIHQARRRMRDAPRAARGATPAALAAEGEQLVVAALPATQPQEPVGLYASLQEGIELVLDEAGQFTASTGLSVHDETGRVLLHQCPSLNVALHISPVATTA